MLFNRYFVIMFLSVFLISVIFWWQKPMGAVSAMAGGSSKDNPYHLVKNYWSKMDYRQFDFAEQMIADSARGEHQQLQKTLTDNPLLSIQKVQIESTTQPNKLLAKITSGSVIDNRQENYYLIELGNQGDQLLIRSIEIIPKNKV